MENNLTFIKTLTIEQFLTQQNAKELDIVKNPNTGKLFIAIGNQTVGSVSSKGIPNNPVVSLVEGDEGQFYLLHEKNTTNVVKTFSL